MQLPTYRGVKTKKSVEGSETQPRRDLIFETFDWICASVRQTVACETPSLHPLAGNGSVSVYEPPNVEL